jgi:alginate O-acetyltransferase complex protein AlgI
MAISYVVDIYRRELEPAKPLDLAVYISFFPHLLAGPIVRGGELLPQIRRRRDPNSIDYSRAFWLILAGLFKKVVISSYVSSAIVTPVFTSPTQHSAPEAIFAAWGYAVQIYCDFSGYTDIAIGLAMLLGFRFPQNFDAPYTARNLQDFWRRWHMTLSRWLRDYLYIPLGGSANGQAQTVRNIMITMVLGGLWHGAAWTFVVWGTLQGVGQSFGHIRRKSRERRGLPGVAEGPVRDWVQRFLTFQYVCLGWVFFNATGMSQAFSVIGRLFSGWGQGSPLITPLLVITIAGTLASQFVPPLRVDRLQAAFSRQRTAVQVGLLGFALLGVTTFGPVGVAPFIYYRF